MCSGRRRSVSILAPATSSKIYSSSFNASPGMHAVPMQSNTVLYIELVTDFEHLNNLLNKKVWMVKTGRTISTLLQFLPPNIIV